LAATTCHQHGKTNLSDDSLFPAHVTYWSVNNARSAFMVDVSAFHVLV